MTTAAPILLFLSVFFAVFCLGMQSQLVNNGHLVLAALNSFAIGVANIILYKLAPDATGAEVAAYIAGGPVAIVASMYTYRRYQTWHTQRGSAPTAPPTPSTTTRHKGPTQ